MADVLLYTGSTAIDVTFDARSYEACGFFVDGLGAAETVAVSVSVNGSWVTCYDYNGAGAANAAVIFTGSGGTPANVKMWVGAGQYYRFTASDPAGTVTIVALPYAKSNA